jgi:hypothetical protein
MIALPNMEKPAWAKNDPSIEFEFYQFIKHCQMPNVLDALL